MIYAGTASKTLAPGLRLGWLVAPRLLIAPLLAARKGIDLGPSKIDQHALAHLITSGAFDRHLRRMRAHYRLRRDTLVDALGSAIPECCVGGISAGLHATVRLPQDVDAEAVARRRSDGASGLA